MKKILITGGYGILGSCLANKLDDMGHDVFILDRSKKERTTLNRFINKSIQKQKGNFNELKSLLNIIKKKKFDVIFHLGAITQVIDAYKSPYDTFKTNVMGTINILESIRILDINTKVIFSSSDKAYGTMMKKEYSEDDRLHGDFPYDVSKSSSDLIAQSYSKTYGLSVAIIRSGNIFGPADFNLDRLIPGTIVNALRGKPITLRTSGKLRRDYIYVSDVADAYIKMMKFMFKDKKKLHIYNLGSKNNFNANQVVDKIYKIMNVGLKSIIKDKSRIEIEAQKLNFSKAKKDLKWNPKIDFKSGVLKTLKWYGDNLHLFNK